MLYEHDLAVLDFFFCISILFMLLNIADLQQSLNGEMNEIKKKQDEM